MILSSDSGDGTSAAKHNVAIDNFENAPQLSQFLISADVRYGLILR